MKKNTKSNVANRQKVLIFGSRGMLAGDLIVSFKKDGFLVIGVDKDVCDITKEESVRLIINQTKPNLIINTAVLQNLDECDNNPVATMMVNAIGPSFIAKHSGKLGIPFVQLSTIYVFEGNKPSYYTEDDRPNPVNVYGITKLNAEYFTKLYNPKNYIIRTNFLFGKNYNPKITKTGNFVQRILLLARQNSELKVVTDQIISATYTKDLAETILKIVKTDKYGTYHVTNSGHTSLYDFTKKILELAKLKNQVNIKGVKLADFSQTAKRPQYTIARSVKLSSIGIKAPRSWQDALSAYLDEIG